MEEAAANVGAQDRNCRAGRLRTPSEQSWGGTMLRARTPPARTHEPGAKARHTRHPGYISDTDFFRSVFFFFVGGFYGSDFLLLFLFLLFIVESTI